MKALRIIRIDLAGNGYYVLLEGVPMDGAPVWLNSRRRPMNFAESERVVAGWKKRMHVTEVIEHVDFNGGLPPGFEGRVV